jgi:hypothetical protein
MPWTFIVECPLTQSATICNFVLLGDVVPIPILPLSKTLLLATVEEELNLTK